MKLRLNELKCLIREAIDDPRARAYASMHDRSSGDPDHEAYVDWVRRRGHLTSSSSSVLRLYASEVGISQHVVDKIAELEGMSQSMYEVRFKVEEGRSTRDFSPSDIMSAARRVLKDGYGDGAYISDVASQLGVAVKDIESTLNDLNRQQKITLRRADLVGAMDRSKLDRSAIRHPMLRSAENHFIVVPQQFTESRQHCMKIRLSEFQQIIKSEVKRMMLSEVEYDGSAAGKRLNRRLGHTRGRLKKFSDVVVQCRQIFPEFEMTNSIAEYIRIIKNLQHPNDPSGTRNASGNDVMMMLNHQLYKQGMSQRQMLDVRKILVPKL
jgi:hypothetical protein